MAITDINEYAHLTDADVEALGAELDALRREIEADRGMRDVRYRRRTILAHRALEVAGRAALMGSGIAHAYAGLRGFDTHHDRLGLRLYRGAVG